MRAKQRHQMTKKSVVISSSHSTKKKNVIIMVRILQNVYKFRYAFSKILFWFFVVTFYSLSCFNSTKTKTILPICSFRWWLTTNFSFRFLWLLLSSPKFFRSSNQLQSNRECHCQLLLFVVDFSPSLLNIHASNVYGNCDTHIYLLEMCTHTFNV